MRSMPIPVAKAPLIGLAAITFGLLLASAAAAQEPVSLQLKWRHQFQFAGYYAAVAHGFYREAGLEVALREGGPSIDAAAEVAAGRADFGVCTTAALPGWARGERLVVLAAVFQHSAAVILVPARAGINALPELRGHRLMDAPGSDEIAAMLRRAGVDYAQLPRVEHHGDPRDLIAGKADAMIAYTTNEPFVLEQLGERYRLFSPRDAGIDFYGDNLCTSAGYLAAHAQRVQAFRAASLKGWHYALEHKGEVADLIHDRYGAQKDRAALLFEAQQTEMLIHPDLVEIGQQDAERWRQIAATYRDLGVTADATVPQGLIYRPPAAR